MKYMRLVANNFGAERKRFNLLSLVENLEKEDSCEGAWVQKSDTEFFPRRRAGGSLYIEPALLWTDEEISAHEIGDLRVLDLLDEGQQKGPCDQQIPRMLVQG